MAGTSLNSPVLALLASQQGQISRPLDTADIADIKNMVQSCYAVGVDLSTLTPESAAADPVIRAALEVGTPIVFENNDALLSFLSAQEGLATEDTTIATEVMAAAISFGVESQIAVVVPSVDPDATVMAEIFCLGASSIQELLPTGTLDGGEGVTAEDLAAALLTRPLLPSTVDLPITDPASLVSLINSAISEGISSREFQNLTSSSAPPTGITKKEFLIRYSGYVWYPRGRSQDFVIQCSLRAQLFYGNGGERKWLRLIVDDSTNTAGFLNRGALVFDEGTDRGYIMGGAEVMLKTTAPWVSFYSLSPVAQDAGPNGVWFSSYTPQQTRSETSFNVDYTDNGVAKTWTSIESRTFRSDEYRLMTWPPNSSDWKMPLMFADDPCSSSLSRRLDHDSDGDEVDYDWENLTGGCGSFQGHVSVFNKAPIARGVDQTGLHPKVQATYWVPATEERTAHFSMKLYQEVWNIWIESIVPGDLREYRNVYSAQVTKGVSVNFNRLSATSKMLWSSGTSGNPGAKLMMTGDGNLIIYKDEKILWMSNTMGNPGAYKVMQGDGNLVIYSKDGRALWASGTNGNPGAYDVMQDDGNYVIYAGN